LAASTFFIKGGRRMKRISILFSLLLLSSMLTFSLQITCVEAEARIWTVDDDGPADFDTIQEAINAASDGDTILVNAGTYYEHVAVNKTLSLVGEDVKTTIIDGNGTGHVINILSDNVNVTGFTVQKSGNVHMPALDAGICLNSTEGCNISENRVVDNGFCGISLLNSQENTITRNNITHTEWGGIHLMGSSRNTVSLNIVENTFGSINGHASSHYNNFTENVISNSTYGMFYNNANYNNICGNNISATEVIGIWLQEQVSYNNVAENNLINNTVAIRLQGPNRNNTLSGNFITGAEYGIKLENTQYVSITDNTIVNNRAGSDSWSAGIRLDYGRDTQINSNIISGNHYGILVYASSPRVSAYGNNISDNEFGVRVASGGSNNLNMTRNLVANSVSYGIGLTGFGSSSNYATISQNTITNNSDGIALGQYSDYNTIVQNNINQNKCGFYIEFSTQNTICSNNIVENDVQVNITSASANVWDNGYPSGGNYWSDCSGTDLCCGAYQNETGSDGIADEPHIIDTDNKDRYPLINPWAPQALITDINDDGAVNILDISIVAKAFGTKQGDSMYDEAADLDKNGHVNIIDISRVAKDYGKTV
jgi:parallel beta-helix repeat protein